MKNNRQYAVLGLGIFGSTVSKTLSKYNIDKLLIEEVTIEDLFLEYYK